MTAVVLFIRVALSLSGGNTHSGGDAVLEDLLADEGWHGAGVVLQTRRRLV